jgi:hypothetical protein
VWLAHTIKSVLSIYQAHSPGLGTTDKTKQVKPSPNSRIHNHSTILPRMYQNTPKVPGTPTENTKNRRLPIDKGVEPLAVTGGLFVQGTIATGTVIVTTAMKQLLPLAAEEESLALRLKEYVGVALILLSVDNVWLASFEFEAMVEEESKTYVVPGPIMRLTICVSYRAGDSVTTVMVFDEDPVGRREDTVVEVTVTGDSVVLYEEEFA